ncbi:LysR family transcriptional regulator StgR [Streptomyces malaysiensis subsp. malaysiensis]|uniref:LysR family transcriptional regulator n=1 Tax=Streptomyces malaysiensis TaxID=92644 RepID=A0ABX6WCL2_STRMQ|nr:MULTISPECIES: LysR family transcriptional regulator [Streptomyces]QPI57611.1 LysR family transcriptional regulator [Streptomyces solisilvae]UHH19177.1 LysR family transcriptional regulator [Streptomyces sp. HNM0561]
MSPGLKPEDIDLRLVRYVTVLAEELHFGHAADRLHIAQQTLSAQISRLEQRLGTALFVRDRRHVALTDAGAVFVAGGRKLLDSSATLLMEVCASGRPIRLDVITEGLTTGLIAQHVRTRLPEITLEVVQRQGLVGSLEHVSRGEIDLAFGRVTGVPPIWKGTFRCLLVRLEPMGVVLPEHHVLAAGDVVRLGQLRDFPVLLHTAVEARDWEGWNTALVEHFGLTVGRRLHGHGRAAANAAALAYGMPTLAPVRAPLPEGLLVRELHDPIPLCPMWLVWRDTDRSVRAPKRAADLDAVIEEVDRLARDQGWRDLPSQPWWLPETDRAELGDLLSPR